MELKHTPGPWAALPEEADKPYLRIRGTRLGGRYKIANVIEPCYEGARQIEAEESRANARLIAAAPDLLEALRKIAAANVGEDGCYYTNRANIQIAKSAVAAVERAK
jgi:hypothetical protein